MDTVSVSVQPFASVAVTVYVPAVSPVALAEVEPEDQTKVFVPVPPVAEAVADPFDPPLHDTFVGVPTLVVTPVAGCVMVVVSVSVHPLASVTVTVYVPAVNEEAVAEEPPPPDHAYVLVPVPPVAEAVADPLEPPKQDTFVVVPMLATRAAG